ncbi:MAG: DUF3368 domain-containing protein [Acidobacteriota bacterium]
MLETVGQLPLSFYCPHEVWKEVTLGVQKGYPRIRVDWLQIRDLSDPLDPVAAASLDEGEASVIQLALESGITTVCIDERRGRRAAASVGLQVVGTLGLLLRAKRLGSLPALRPVIARLQSAGYWYASDLVSKILEAAGEA